MFKVFEVLRVVCLEGIKQYSILRTVGRCVRMAEKGLKEMIQEEVQSCFNRPV